MRSQDERTIPLYFTAKYSVNLYAGGFRKLQILRKVCIGYSRRLDVFNRRGRRCRGRCRFFMAHRCRIAVTACSITGSAGYLFQFLF